MKGKPVRPEPAEQGKRSKAHHGPHKETSPPSPLSEKREGECGAISEPVKDWTTRQKIKIWTRTEGETGRTIGQIAGKHAPLAAGRDCSSINQDSCEQGKVWWTGAGVFEPSRRSPSGEAHCGRRYKETTIQIRNLDTAAEGKADDTKIQNWDNRCSTRRADHRSA